MESPVAHAHEPFGRRLGVDLALGAGLLLTGGAAFFGDGAGAGALPWLGGGGLLAIVVLLAIAEPPAGAAALLPLGALTAWIALSIAWSTLPDRSWTYANRSFTYLTFAILGLWLAPRLRLLALGLIAILGALAFWTLLGKVTPHIADYGEFDGTRLRGPVGLWNQVALLGSFALGLALWRRRLSGVLLAYLWLVVLGLTESRGGVAVAAIIVAAWLAFGEERLASAAMLVAAAVPAAVVTGVAFALPGITSDAQSFHVRSRDGIVFGALLIGGALAAAALARVPPPPDSRTVRRALLTLGAVAIAAALVVGAFKARSAWRSFTSSAQVTNSSNRFGSAASNYRWQWWRQAWRAFEHHPVAGTGAGSFELTNKRYRTSYLDQTIEPHSVGVQFLSETGLVGLALLAAVGVGLIARARRGHGVELALGLILPAYLLHSLVDVDWDFAAVSAPVFLVAGALIGRPASARRLPAPSVLAVAGASLLAFGALLLPWLGERWTSQSELTGSPAHAVSLARRARSVDPLSAEAVWAQALQTSGYAKRQALYALATRKEPENPRWWLAKAEFELQAHCARAALEDFYRFVAYDPYAAPTEGPDDYRRALALVNSGTPTC